MNPNLPNLNTSSDIMIVGAGLIGLSLANLCANAGFKVALIERESFPNLPGLPGLNNESPALSSTTDSNIKNINDFDLRAFAISRASANILRELKLWEYIKPFATPYYAMKVWDSLSFGEITFNAKDVGEENLGHIIENCHLLKPLWELTLQQENITVSFNTTATKLHVLETEALVTVHDSLSNTVTHEVAREKTLRSKLIVSAEGANSTLRTLAGVEVDQKSYHQEALVANVRTTFPHQNIAWQQFLPEGPLAFLPLSDPHCASIVWTANSLTHKKNQQLSKNEFCRMLATAFDYRLGEVLECSRKITFPLSMLHAKQYVKPRIAFIGDASHVIHPLAGQGIHLGMQDVFVLMQVLCEAQKRECDIGDYLILRKYERRRKGPITKMITSLTALNTLFTKTSSPVTFLRGLGLSIADNAVGIKRKLIQEAMGL